MSKAEQSKRPAVQTTGHAWDGDLQEYNNPLPNWWVWTFYGTIVFSIVYWVLFPSFPIGTSYTKGMFNNITFTNEKGEEVTTHWNTRSLFLRDMQTGDAAMRQKAYLNEISAASMDQILADPEKMSFVRSMSKVLFAENCAGCHGSGADGIVGLFPSLVDDDWLWGGKPEQITETLTNGRLGYMPQYADTFNAQQLEEVSSFVLSMSGIEGGKPDQIEKGKEIFQGSVGGCYYCHTPAGTGLASVGAANLTDSIWTVANVPSAETYEAKLAEVKSVIAGGISRHMPAMSGRLSEDEIKLLTVYVHQLGGGQ